MTAYQLKRQQAKRHQFMCALFTRVQIAVISVLAVLICITFVTQVH